MQGKATAQRSGHHNPVCHFLKLKYLSSSNLPAAHLALALVAVSLLPQPGVLRLITICTGDFRRFSDRLEERGERRKVGRRGGRMRRE